MNREPKLLKFYEHKAVCLFSKHNADVSNVSFLIIFFLSYDFFCCYEKQRIISIIDKEKQEQNHEVHVHLWQTRKDWLQRETLCFFFIKYVICKQDDERGLVITSSNANQ